MIPYGRQSINDDDIEAVVKVLRGDWLTQGPAVEEFETALTFATQAQYAIAFSSGTAALHAACLAAHIGPGDRVATSTLSFVASANCALYVGADVDLLDVDPTTLNIDPTSVPSDVDALVAVHYAGLPVDLTRLNHRPRVVIEDAAHAIGAGTPDGPVGNCAHSDMTCFSFHPVKTITTGEGGAVTTNAPELAERLRRVRHHGTQPGPGVWQYRVVELGYNYRLSDLHAALGHSQLSRLGALVAERNRLAARYRAELEALPVEMPPEGAAGVVHGRHLFPLRIDDRDGVRQRLADRGVGTQTHYIPIHHHPLHAESPRRPLTNADEAFSRLLSIPLYPDLGDESQDRVIAALRDSL